MSTEKYYNIPQKSFYAESVQKVRVVRNAKRYKKSQNLLRRNTPHPLRRNVLNSMVLQKPKSQVDAAKSCTFSSEKQPLYNGRIAFSSFTYHNSWTWAFKFYKDTTVQRFFPNNSWIEKLPKRHYLASFPFEAYTSGAKTNTFSSRSPSAKNAILSHGAIKRNTGLRYHHLNRIWPPGRSPQRIQSIQTRPALISSVTLLRSSYPRLPARKISSWRRTYWNREERVHRKCLVQPTFLHIQGKGPGRLQVVRPRDSSSSRRKENRLCHRSQSQPAYPAHLGRSPLSRVQEKLGGSRIPLSTSSVFPSPLYRGAKAITGKRQRSINPLYLEKACLPCDSYESRPSSGERLEVLLRPSRNRAKYQRTEMGLLSFQDTHKELFSKQGILPSSFIRLQYNKLVQTAMSAGTISIRHITNYSQRALGTASTAGKIWQQKLAPTAETLCLQLGIRLCN